MSRPALSRPTIVRTLRTALLIAAAAVALAGGIEIALFAHDGPGPLWVTVLIPAVGFLYAAAGSLAWWRRPSNPLGAIMLVGALSLLLNALAHTHVPVLAAIGIVTATVPLGVVVHLLHAFPSGRLRSAVSRRTVVAGYAVCLLLQVPLYLLAPNASPAGILAAGDQPGLATAGTWLQRAAGLTVMALTAAILTGRLADATRRQRRVLAPLYVYALAAILAVPLTRDVLQPITGIAATTVTVTQVGLLAVVPVAFAAATLLGGFARTSELQELGAWLGAATAHRPDLADALKHTLGDPSLQLAYCTADPETYIDADGQPMRVPDDTASRALAHIELGHRRVGAILYDATLIEDPELVRAAGRVIALALDQQRLTAELRASQQQLQHSRARVLEAGDRERRRIAQNLHDGLQAELVLLAVEAQRLAGQPGTPTTTARDAIALRARIDDAAADLRQLVHGVMPAALIERGLAAATEDLIDRMPVPTSLDITLGSALPPAVESTAYYVIAEALTNAVKHADAAKIAVRVDQHQHHLTVQISDDGAGGAHLDTATHAGLGLTGIADRVDILGGRLHLDSTPGRGTHLIAELPCES